MKILKHGAWPKLPKNVAVYLPKEIEREMKNFEDFYLNEFSGREIRWLYQKCKGVMTFYGPSNEKKTLSVSIYQMAILLQFNDNDKLSLHELHALTGIPENYLIPVARILLKSGIFKSKDFKVKEKVDEVTMASEIEFNLDFKSYVSNTQISFYHRYLTWKIETLALPLNFRTFKTLFKHSKRNISLISWSY